MNDWQKFPQEDFNKFKNDIQKTLKIIIPIFIVLLILSGVSSTYYTVETDEEAVVIRLGKNYKTQTSGLHFKLPFGIDQVIKVKTTTIFQEEFGFRTRNVSSKRTVYATEGFDDESLMLTGDLNIADVEWVVQYKVSDAFKYIYQTREPITNIRDISESIMRRVVGDRLVTDVLTIGREETAQEAKDLMQKVLDRYDMGVKIESVKLQDVNPPPLVKPSFNEVNEAKQEQEKMINMAEEVYNRVIPEAKGKAEKKIAEAEGEALALINKAQGDSAKFLSVLKEYNTAKRITENRIYLETMEEIFKKMKDVTIVDLKVKGLLPIYSKSLFEGGQK